MIDDIEDDWKTEIVAHSFIGKRRRILLQDKWMKRYHVMAF